MTELIHCENLENAKKIVEYFIKNFYFKHQDSSLNDSLNTIEKIKENDCTDADEEETDDCLSDDLPPELNGVMKSSKYFQVFDDMKNNISENSVVTQIPNVF